MCSKYFTFIDIRKLKCSFRTPFCWFRQCEQPFVYIYVPMCMYVRQHWSLYLVGIRPLALLLITLPCLLRPCNLPPLKCGFKKKKKKRGLTH